MIAQELTWYDTLVKPALTPPSGVFSPVWTLLYALMAVAAWRIWRTKRSALRSRALVLFAVQLALNLAWSPIFFGAQLTGVAFIVILVMWCAIAATIASFARLDRAAAWLLAPYLLWVSFAVYLNGAIWLLNR